jgi:hypothetical protein
MHYDLKPITTRMVPDLAVYGKERERFVAERSECGGVLEPRSPLSKASSKLGRCSIAA